MIRFCTKYFKTGGDSLIVCHFWTAIPSIAITGTNRREMPSSRLKGGFSSKDLVIILTKLSLRYFCQISSHQRWAKVDDRNVFLSFEFTQSRYKFQTDTSNVGKDNFLYHFDGFPRRFDVTFINCSHRVITIDYARWFAYYFSSLEIPLVGVDKFSGVESNWHKNIFLVISSERKLSNVRNLTSLL